MTSPPANPLGKTSLALGIASSAFVFGLGLCGLIGGARLPGVAQLLFVCGASSAFLGLIAALVGAGGLFLGGLLDREPPQPNETRPAVEQLGPATGLDAEPVSQFNDRPAAAVVGQGSAPSLSQIRRPGRLVGEIRRGPYRWRVIGNWGGHGHVQQHDAAWEPAGSAVDASSATTPQHPPPSTPAESSVGR